MAGIPGGRDKALVFVLELAPSQGVGCDAIKSFEQTLLEQKFKAIAAAICKRNCGLVADYAKIATKIGKGDTDLLNLRDTILGDLNKVLYLFTLH